MMISSPIETFVWRATRDANAPIWNCPPEEEIITQSREVTWVPRNLDVFPDRCLALVPSHVWHGISTLATSFTLVPGANGEKRRIL